MSRIFLGSPTPAVKQFIIEHYGHSEPSELETPLYFEANEPGASIAMLAFNEDMWEQIPLQCHLQYSTDSMQTWNTWDGSIVDLDECQDNRVYLRADPENPNTNGFYDQENFIYHYFKTDGSVKAGGNIQFLLESTGTRPDVPAYGFCQLFGHVSYDEETGENIYDCVSLTQAPALPATTLADSCYYIMFRGCTSLIQAPALEATTLANSCYSGMFNRCTSLSSIKVLFSAWNPSNATQNWVDGVAAEGTFTCPSDLPQTTGSNNIPNGWTIVTK